jgi:threonine/homoserine/homoserine lactone efflux protein
MFRWTFRSRARHPLARLLGAVVAVAALVVVLAFGLFAVAAIAIGGAAVLIYNALRGTRRPSPASSGAPNPSRSNERVIEGEFKVVQGDGQRQAQS